MKNLRALLGLTFLSLVAVVISGFVLNYLGIEHGPLLIKIASIFIIVNIILYLLVLIFFFCRNLFRLYREKRRRVIGSKFRTRLIASFLGLVLIPSALLFFLSFQLINNSIDTWFSLQIQKPIYDSMDVAKTFYLQERQNAERFARLIASNRVLRNETLMKEDTGSFASYYLEKPDGSAIVDEAFAGKTGTDILSTDKGDIIRAASPVTGNGRINGVVVVETIIPKETVTKMESIQRSFNDYMQIKAQQSPVRFVYFLMLTVATLLIIFLTLWISLRIAKGITVPIQSLAEATETVAHGNLDFRIELTRDDEIGMLINSFNRMLDDIRVGKESLEKAYRESDRRRISMESILESINTGVIFFDRSGMIITVNNAACSMLGIDRATLSGKNYRKLLNRLQSEELTGMVRRLSEKGFGSVEKEIHIHINGRPMDFRVYMTLIKDSSGKFIGTLVVFDNLTEIITAQRALAWQEVARRIAHEIKNPLTPIRLSAERLLKKWNEQSEDFGDILTRSTKTIVHEVNSLRALVDEFSRFGKMPRIVLEPTRIETIIEEVNELYSNVKGLRIITSILSEIPEIEIDKQQMKMALINLIDNAVQAGTTTIWINVHYHSEQDVIELGVIDDGSGIRDEDKDKLFFPYFSTRKEGTGLGLAIVNSIISKHRGHIRVQDNKPRGTQFIIELPVGHK